MKISDVKQIVTNSSELLEILVERSKEGEISRDEVSTTILNHSNKEAYIQLFLKATSTSTNKHASDVEKKLVKHLHEEYKGDDRDYLCKKYTADLYVKIQDEERNKVLEREKLLPEYMKIIEKSAVRFSQVTGEYEKLAGDEKHLKHLSEVISTFRRVEKSKTFFDFASWKEQSFAFSALPANVEKARKYMESVIKKGGNLFISCHEATEAPNKCRDFWKNEEVLKGGFDGAQVVKKSEEIFAIGKDEKHKLIETTLELDDGRKISHIHYFGWVDRTSCPDEDLLEMLLARMATLSPDPDKHIAINCHGGVGRTGSVAGCYLVRKQIDQKLKETMTSIDELEINIPYMIVDMRKFRDILGSGHHIKTIYSRTAAYFGRIQLGMLQK